MNPDYPFRELEKKIQLEWDDSQTFSVSEKSNKPKFYVLSMFLMLRSLQEQFGSKGAPQAPTHMEHTHTHTRTHRTRTHTHTTREGNISPPRSGWRAQAGRP